MYTVVSLTKNECLSGGNCSYILRLSVHDLHGPTVTKSRGGTKHVSSSPSGNDTLSLSIPTMSFNSGVGMMYSVPELPTCIPFFIASDSTVLAKSGMYRRGMFLGGSFSSSLSELFLCWLSLGSVCCTGVAMLFLRAFRTRSSGFSVLTSWLFPCCLVYI